MPGSAKTRILSAAIDELVESGLTGWTVERVASRAGTAKGLVLYHFRTRAALLSEAARAIRDQVVASREKALASRTGTAAVDALWQTVLEGQGLQRARLALLGVTGSGPPDPPDSTRLATLAAAALDLRPTPPSLQLLDLTLDACALALLEGRPAEQIRDQLDRFFLALLS